MNNAVKGLIGLSIFGTGFGAGWLVASKHFEKEFKAALVEVNDSLKEELNSMYGRKNMPVSEDIDEYDEEEEPEKSHDPNKDFTDEISKDDPFKGMTMEEIQEARDHHRRVVTDYTKCYHAKPSIEELATSRLISNEHDVEEDEPEEYEDAETDEEREIREGEALGRVNHEHPYIIEPEQYDSECSHYDKIELYYYSKDDTLCDEQDSPMDDTEDYDDALSQLQMQTNVYVRNEAVGADYAIYRLNRSYKEDVLGIAETPREREFRHIARKKSAMDGED